MKFAGSHFTKIYQKSMPRFTICRKEHFNAAHRLHIPSLGEEENTRIFGKCSNLNFHGHNYNLWIYVTGEQDLATGFVVDMKWLSDLIKREIIDWLDHKNLNLDIEEFKNLNPTAENIAWVIYNRLRYHLILNLELRIHLFETERNLVIFPPI